MEYKAAPDGVAPARYLFRTRVLPGCGWKLVTVVRSSLLTQGMNRIGVLLGLVILALLGLFVLFSRYFLNGIVEPVHAVAEGMEQLVNNESAGGCGRSLLPGRSRTVCSGAVPNR